MIIRHFRTTLTRQVKENEFIVFFLLQNYLNESLKFLEKSYPSGSISSLHANAMQDTKPIYIDTKTLLHQSGMHDKK